MNNFERYLISVLIEGTATGEDTYSTSRKVHKFVQNDRWERNAVKNKQEKQFGGGGDPSPKGGEGISKQVERIRQRVLDRKRKKGQSEDSIEQEKKTWGKGMWKETGKRSGEGNSRINPKYSMRFDRRGSEESGGGRRGGEGSRRDPDSQPSRKKWRLGDHG